MTLAITILEDIGLAILCLWAVGTPLAVYVGYLIWRDSYYLPEYDAFGNPLHNSNSSDPKPDEWPPDGITSPRSAVRSNYTSVSAR